MYVYVYVYVYIHLYIYIYIYIYIYVYKYYERKKGCNYISRQACFVNRFTLQGKKIEKHLPRCAKKKKGSQIELWNHVTKYIKERFYQ